MTKDGQTQDLQFQRWTLSIANISSSTYFEMTSYTRMAVINVVTFYYDGVGLLTSTLKRVLPNKTAIFPVFCWWRLLIVLPWTTVYRETFEGENFHVFCGFMQCHESFLREFWGRGTQHSAGIFCACVLKVPSFVRSIDMSLLNYFQTSSSLPKPDGPLST